ncbi:MAG TPA: RDD family protein [Ruminiclostridium sp.]|jgi:uncharacterized RDD family membrane protein YckC|nr:RDD family protein [Clostridiaceae bacterium]HAA25264.1 RDD family protein [Ruminiclostridium sp.]
MRNVLSIRTPENVKLDFELASVGSRGAAVVIDMIIQYILILSSVLAILLIAGEESINLLFAENNTIYIVICLLIIFTLQFGYFLLFEFFMKGSTLGKKMVGLKVMMANGEPVSFSACLIRNFIRIADMLPGVYLIGICSVLFTKRFMRIGDLAANTVVVKIKKMEEGIESIDGAISLSRKHNLTTKEEALLTEYISRRRNPKNPLSSDILESQLFNYFYRKFGPVPNLPDNFSRRVYLDKLLEFLSISPDAERTVVQ